MMLSVSSTPTETGWSCAVTVGDDPAATHHVVAVARDEVSAFGVAAETPDVLVRAAFAFLLEREPRESILRQFELQIIGRYFPGWEADVRGRLSAPDRSSST